MSDRTFTVDDPRTLEGVISSLPAGAVVPEIEFSYDITPPKGTIRDELSMATCIHCKYPNHWHGFVMRFHDGSRILVGKDCGFKLYGADFDAKHSSFKSERATSLRISRIRTIDAQIDRCLGELWVLSSASVLIDVGLVKRQLRDRMPALSKALGAVATSEGTTLVYEKVVEDVMGQLRHTRPEDETKPDDGSKKEKKPKIRTETRNHGQLRGAGLFRTERSPSTWIKDYQTKLRELWRPDRKSGKPTPLERAENRTLTESRAGTLVTETKRAVEAAEEMIALGYSLAAFFERDNLIRIVRWTKDLPNFRGRYALTKGGGLFWEDDQTGEKVTVAAPKDFAIPPTPALERLKRALVSGG